MNTPTVVYIYGLPGCGKTRLLRETFADSCNGVAYKGNVRICIWDDANYSGFCHIKIPACDYFIISGNLQPDDIPIHLDHIFCLDSAEALKECRAFLSSIYGQ